MKASVREWTNGNGKTRYQPTVDGRGFSWHTIIPGHSYKAFRDSSDPVFYCSARAALRKAERHIRKTRRDDWKAAT